MSQRNRYDDDHRTQAERDADFEEIMEMSEAESDREMDSQLRQLEEHWARLTPAQQRARRRRSALRNCISWRLLARQGFVPELAMEYVRSAQKRLLQIRLERGGIQSGSA